MNFKHWIENNAAIRFPILNAPNASQKHDELALLIHKVPIDKGVAILHKLGMTGRSRGITKSNILKFKNALMSIVASSSPELVSFIMKSDALDFKPVIDLWKLHMPATIKNNDEDLSLADVGEPEPSIQKPESIEDQIDDQGIMQNFPPIGSQLYERLYWIYQSEKEGRFTLASTIIRELFLMEYKPSGLEFKSNSAQLLSHYMFDGDRGLNDGQIEGAKKLRSLYGSSVFEDLAYGKVDDKTLAELIDRLAHNKVARLLADEINWIAEQFAKNWQPGSWLPKIDLNLIKRMTQVFNNQKYYGESRLK